MAPWSSKKAGQGQISHDGTAAAVNSASSSSNGKEAKDEFESSKPSSAAVNRSTSCSPKKRKKQEQHHPDVPVKLSRPPLSFLFAIFLNQFYINLIVLVPRQVGIYIIRQRFLPQDDPAAQMTGEEILFFLPFFTRRLGAGHVLSVPKRAAIRDSAVVLLLTGVMVVVGSVGRLWPATEALFFLLSFISQGRAVGAIEGEKDGGKTQPLPFKKKKKKKSQPA